MSDANRLATTFRAQVGGLSDFVLATWRARYIVGEGMDFRARAILNQEAAAVRSEGNEPDALTIWLRLIDRATREGGSQELLAATALAGLATGLRSSGFEQAPERPPGESVTPG